RGLDLARRELFRGELDDPERAMLIFGRKLGEALAQQGDYLDAEGVLREALDMAGPGGQDRARVLGALAHVAHGRSRNREAEAYLGRGANRVIAAERVEQAVAEVLRPLLRVPARAALRLPVRLQVLGGGLQRRVVCESVNLSRHGALLRAPHSLIEGTELRFELFLPEAPLPVCGEAVVVRRTAQGREPYPGIGVQFIAFALGAEDAIKARVDAYRSGRLRPVN
ncbi:MAG: hypothetical protein B7Z68_10940, partial [Acidobacteria bacterium 21-70-11]